MVQDIQEVEKSLERSKYKLMIIALKAIPMLLSFCAAANTFFGFFGVRTDVLSILGGVSLLPLLFLYLASYVFRFCVYHRMFLHYILVTDAINMIDFYIGIPIDTRALFGLFVLITGIFLLLILYFYRKERCCKTLRTSYCAS